MLYYLCDWLDFWVWKILGVGGLAGGEVGVSFLSSLLSKAIGIILSFVEPLPLTSVSTDAGLITRKIHIIIISTLLANSKTANNINSSVNYEIQYVISLKHT